MFNKILTNNLINRIVPKVNDLLIQKDLNQNICDYLYLVAVGLILKYGEFLEDDILSLFSKVKIETKYNNIRKISNKYKKADLFSDDTVKIWTFYDEEYDEYIICINDNIEFKGILFLELLVKEFNKMLNSIKNKDLAEDGCVIKRCGLCQKYIYDNKTIKIEGNIINEVFNILQSEDIMKIILDLRSNNIDCNNIRNILNGFSVINSEEYSFSGSNVLVNIFRRLYNIDDFKNMITNILLNGNVNKLKESIDDALGFDAYKILDYNLTEAYINFEEAKITNLKVYDYTLRHCLLRNMINLYIKKNYEN